MRVQSNTCSSPVLQLEPGLLLQQDFNRPYISHGSLEHLCFTRTLVIGTSWIFWGIISNTMLADNMSSNHLENSHQSLVNRVLPGHI